MRILEIKVANINIFWSNGSYETPVIFPDHTKFKVINNANINLFSPELGSVELDGEYNYAFCNNSFYFLEKLNSEDVKEGIHVYGMIRDLTYELSKITNLRVSGTLNKCTDEKLLRENIEFTKPLIDNPLGIEYQQILEINKSGKIEILKPKKIDPDDFVYFIHPNDWTEFVEQYEKIPENKRILQKTTTTAIWAVLKTRKVKNWKIDALKKLNDFLDDLKLNPKNYVIIQNTNDNFLKGRYLISEKTKATLEGLKSEIKHLKKINLEGATDINKRIIFKEEYNKDLFANLNPEAEKADAKPGYVQETTYWANATPWTGSRPYTAGDVSPFKSEFFGIDNDFQFKRLDKSVENYFTVELIKKDLSVLKTKNKELKELDDILKKYAEHQEYCVVNAKDFYQPNREELQYWLQKYRIPHHTGSGSNIFDVPSDSVWKELPKLPDGSFDYEKIAIALYGNRNTETLKMITWGDFILPAVATAIAYDYTYYLFLGNVVLGFYGSSDRLEVETKIHEILKPQTNGTAIKYPELKNEIYSYVYKHLGFDIVSNKYSWIDDIEKNIHLLTIDGTDYEFLLINGIPSLVLKDDSQLELTFEIKALIPKIKKSLHSEINSQRKLVIYNRSFDIKDRGDIESELEIYRFLIGLHQNQNDNFLVRFETPLTRIEETHQIPKSLATITPKDFDLIEYEKKQIQYRRLLEDAEHNKKVTLHQRQMEDYQLRRQKEDTTLQRTQQIVNTVISAGGVVAGGIATAATGGFGAIGVAGAIGAASYAAGSASSAAFEAIRHSKALGDLKQKEKDILASRAFEKYRLETEHIRRDNDFKNEIQLMTNVYTTTYVEDREILQAKNEILKVEDIHILKKYPNAFQINLINKHYSHFGIDCLIHDFDLTAEIIKERSNIWGFNRITDINILDPVLKTWAINKFLTGVKLIKPTFNYG